MSFSLCEKSIINLPERYLDKLFINPISFGRAGGIYQELGVSPTAHLLIKNNPLNLQIAVSEGTKMNNLIQITKNTINGAEINSVNARELYNNLGLAKGQYSRWIQKNLLEQFILHEDYIGVRQIVEGNEVVSHIITLDTAKHLCMMAKTATAMEFRKYFINFEKNAKIVIQSQSSQIQLLQETLNQIAIADQRITKIESNFRIENWQQKRLEEVKNHKVYEIAEKHDLKSDVAMIKKLHSRVWKCLKNKFNIPRYNELPICEFDNGVSFIKKLTLADLI